MAYAAATFFALIYPLNAAQTLLLVASKRQHLLQINPIKSPTARENDIQSKLGKLTSQQNDWISLEAVLKTRKQKPSTSAETNEEKNRLQRALSIEVFKNQVRRYQQQAPYWNRKQKLGAN